MPDNDFIASPDAVAVLAGNPGLQFTRADIQAIAAGTLTLVPLPGVARGCITSLRYGKGSDDLTFVFLDNGRYYTTGPAPAPNETVKNLNDFREVFAQAACCGHGVSFCVNTATDTMSMLNVFPCRCQCKDG